MRRLYGKPRASILIKFYFQTRVLAPTILTKMSRKEKAQANVRKLRNAAINQARRAGVNAVNVASEKFSEDEKKSVLSAARTAAQKTVENRRTKLLQINATARNSDLYAVAMTAATAKADSILGEKAAAVAAEKLEYAVENAAGKAVTKVLEKRVLPFKRREVTSWLAPAVLAEVSKYAGLNPSKMRRMTPKEWEIHLQAKAIEVATNLINEHFGVIKEKSETRTAKLFENRGSRSSRAKVGV